MTESTYREYYWNKNHNHIGKQPAYTIVSQPNPKKCLMVRASHFHEDNKVEDKFVTIVK